MKIALCSDWYSPRIGGLELQMRDLAHELTARGHEVRVLTSTPGPSVVEGVAVERLDLGPLFPKWETMWRPSIAVPLLERAITERRYDVVHCHSAFSPLAQAAAFVARRVGVPSILTEHSVLKGLGGTLLSCANRFVGWSRWPDVLSAVSSYLASEMQSVSGRKVEVLPNGVCPEEWALPRQEPDGLRVVSVMRLTPRKRPIEVVRAIPRVYARLPLGLRPRFTLVGDGPERPRVEREAARLGCTGALELCGWQPREEVKKILARSSVFILPTSKEALSIATLEALAAGLPAVAMNHGGVGDIIHHGREGFLADTSEEFIGYLVRLLEDRELRLRMAQNTRRAVARFAWDQVIARHIELYQMAQDRRAHGSSRVGVPLATAVALT